MGVLGGRWEGVWGAGAFEGRWKGVGGWLGFGLGV